jgi:hypothetical protein
MEIKECPFANLEDCRCLSPAPVGQFEFLEWTPDDHLRHTRFTGLRDRATRIQTSVAHTVDSGKARLTIDDFRSKPAYGGDGNRFDLAYALYALTHGVSEADIRFAIASRDLWKEGPEQRQLNYIERTIRKACSTLGR